MVVVPYALGSHMELWGLQMVLFDLLPVVDCATMQQRYLLVKGWLRQLWGIYEI